MTFVAEGANNEIRKAYVYEEKIGGFRVFDFKTSLTCACEAEDDDGYQCILIGDKTGILFSYSNRNDRTDQDYAGASQTIPAYVILPFIRPGEDDCTYNFRFLTLRALASSNALTVRAFPGFSLQSYESFSCEFDETGFVLDLSQLDVDVLGDERLPVTALVDINKTAETMAIGFYQDIANANIGLISAQLSLNKNGRFAT